MRGLVRDYLTLYCAEQRAVDDMVLCVGEACTNAVCHGGSAAQIEIFLGFRGDDLRVRVKDRGRGFDTAAFDPEAVPDPASERGRGLFLMSQLCDEMTLTTNGGLEVLLVMRAVRRVPAPREGCADTAAIVQSALADAVRAFRAMPAPSSCARSRSGWCAASVVWAPTTSGGA